MIYQNSARELVCLIDFIHNPDGTSRSPKIREGKKTELVIDGIRINSVVREIRAIVKNTNPNENWFLMWFGLTNEELVFYLFRENSTEFNELQQIIPNFRNSGRIENTDQNFANVLNYLETKTENSSITFLQDLELIAQTDEVPTRIIKPRFFDIEKAKLNYAITGKKGEELIAQYLDRLRTENQIKTFNWMNASRESGMPYDFEILQNDDNMIYSDVKTTSYTFEQGMIFSKGELGFISQNTNYHVYRVFDLKEENPSLRICENLTRLSLNLVSNIQSFERDILESQSRLHSLNLAILPSHQLLTFNDRIALR